jgi:hypothetical protein
MSHCDTGRRPQNHVSSGCMVSRCDPPSWMTALRQLLSQRDISSRVLRCPLWARNSHQTDSIARHRPFIALPPAADGYGGYFGMGVRRPLLGAPVVAGASLAACFRFNSARLFAFFLACDRREAIAWSFRREFSASIHQRSETRKAMRRRPISDGPSCLCIGRFNELQKRAIVRSNQRSSGVSGKLANNA